MIELALRSGDLVEYNGDSPALAIGTRGKVLLPVDATGAAHIDFEGRGVGVWSVERFTELDLVDRAEARSRISERICWLIEWMWFHLELRMQGLDDEEFFWEPVPDSWTVRKRPPGEDSLYTGRGEWMYDYHKPDPDPAPFTTIAWRLNHIARINDLYYEYLFGPGKRNWHEQDVPSDSAETAGEWRKWLIRVRDELLESDTEDLGRRVGMPWEWEPEARTVEEWASILAAENVHHGAEIGVLRDLYRETRPND